MKRRAAGGAGHRISRLAASTPPGAVCLAALVVAATAPRRSRPGSGFSGAPPALLRLAEDQREPSARPLAASVDDARDTRSCRGWRAACRLPATPSRDAAVVRLGAGRACPVLRFDSLLRDNEPDPDHDDARGGRAAAPAARRQPGRPAAGALPGRQHPRRHGGHHGHHGHHGPHAHQAILLRLAVHIERERGRLGALPQVPLLAAAAPVPGLPLRPPGREHPDRARPHLQGADTAQGRVAGAGRVHVPGGAAGPGLLRALHPGAVPQAAGPPVPGGLRGGHRGHRGAVVQRQGARAVGATSAARAA